MITYVTNTVHLFVSVILTFIGVTSSIGRFIVLSIVATTSLIFSSLKNVFDFFLIVYEDNVTIFSEDVPYFASALVEALYHQWLYCYNIFMGVYNDTIIKFYFITNNIKWSFTTVFVIISEVLHILKKIFIFTGDTLWLVLTFVPVHLPYLVKAYLKKIQDIITNYVIDTYMALLRVTNFLSDVPFESFIGILTAVLIIRSCIYFRETIIFQINYFYWTLVRRFMYFYYLLYNYFTDSEVRLITQMVGEQDASLMNVDNHIMNGNDDPVEALCVICQERQKCVLTLPCRHVCLCTECCRRLYGYQRTCPICRTFIYHSVTIYL